LAATSRSVVRYFGKHSDGISCEFIDWVLLRKRLRVYPRWH